MIDESRRRKRKGGFLDFAGLAGLQRGSRVAGFSRAPTIPPSDHHPSSKFSKFHPWTYVGSGQKSTYLSCLRHATPIGLTPPPPTELQNIPRSV